MSNKMSNSEHEKTEVGAAESSRCTVFFCEERNENSSSTKIRFSPNVTNGKCIPDSMKDWEWGMEEAGRGFCRELYWLMRDAFFPEISNRLVNLRMGLLDSDSPIFKGAAEELWDIIERVNTVPKFDFIHVPTLDLNRINESDVKLKELSAENHSLKLLVAELKIKLVNANRGEVVP